MRRQLIAIAAVGAGLALAPIFAQDRPKTNAPDPSETPAETDTAAAETEGAAGKRVDETLKNYQGRLERDIAQTRKEIADFRKELKNLIDLRYDASVSLAELRAEMAMRPGAAGFIATPASPPAAIPGTFVPGVPPVRPVLSDQARRHQRLIVLNRELRQIQGLLRNEVQTTRNTTDELVGQLNTLRTRLKQRKVRLKAEEAVIHAERVEAERDEQEAEKPESKP